MNSLIQFIEKQITISNSLKTELIQIFVEENILKGELMSSQNHYCNRLFFIKKGIVKLRFNSDGNEFIMRFFEEGILFTDLESWNTKKLSKYEFVTLENTELISIPLQAFENLCKNHHTLETFYRKLMTRASTNMMARITEMLEEDAKNRYLNFVKTYPHLLQRISLGDLSKYLGITQVSLSRIRANI